MILTKSLSLMLRAFSVLRNFSCQCKLLNEIPWTHKNYLSKHFPHSSVSKEPACNAGDPDLIPESGRSLGEGNSSPLPYSCLENPMDRGALQATVHGVTKSWTRLKQLSTHAYEFYHFSHLEVYNQYHLVYS